jgi:hypothetical protein
MSNCSAILMSAARSVGSEATEYPCWPLMRVGDRPGALFLAPPSPRAPSVSLRRGNDQPTSPNLVTECPARAVRIKGATELEPAA